MYHSQTLSALNKHRISCIRYKIYKQNSGGNQMSVYQRRHDTARRGARAERSESSEPERSGAERRHSNEFIVLSFKRDRT